MDRGWPAAWGGGSRHATAKMLPPEAGVAGDPEPGGLLKPDGAPEALQVMVITMNGGDLPVIVHGSPAIEPSCNLSNVSIGRIGIAMRGA